MSTLQIQTKAGPIMVPTVWAGQNLAVHRPPSSKSPTGLSTEPRHWAITVQTLGLAACASFDGPKSAAVKLAKLWDSAFGAIAASGTAKEWPLAKAWLRDLRAIQWDADYSLNGPSPLPPLAELEQATSHSEIAAAVGRAMGMPDLSPAESAEQYPADLTAKTSGHGAITRCPDSGLLRYWWLPQGQNYSDAEAVSLAGWYELPTMADVESWIVDSIVESPAGDSVEPDHPDSWLSLLGLI